MCVEQEEAGRRARRGANWDKRAFEGSARPSNLSSTSSPSPPSPSQSDYILDAGLAAGLELPYTCQSGICGACVGRVVAGAVDMSDVSSFFG